MKKETVAIGVSVLLALILVIVDVMLLTYHGPVLPRHLRTTFLHEFTRSFIDWFGLILFNGCTIGVITGLLGKWSVLVDAKGMGLFLVLLLAWASGLLLIIA